jgi:methylene-tetrahydromethanopterin dehydrogenase
MERRRLLYITAAEPHVSPFDVNMAYDAGFDAVIPYGGVGAGAVRGFVQDVMFSRGPKGARSSSLLITSADLEEAEASFAAARTALFDPYRIGLMIDPKGAYTTAAALVAKVEGVRRARGLGGIADASVLVLGGTGGVGRAAAAMAAADGARVTLVSRDAARAGQAALAVRRLFHVEVMAEGAATEAERAALAAEAGVILAVGAAGAALLGETSVRGFRGPKILADVNAVPPAGIAGVEARADGAELAPGLFALGAIAVGDLKLKTEAALLLELLGGGPAPCLDANAARKRAAEILARA